jgi:hypothetical protein
MLVAFSQNAFREIALVWNNFGRIPAYKAKISCCEYQAVKICLEVEIFFGTSWVEIPEIRRCNSSIL